MSLKLQVTSYQAQSLGVNSAREFNEESGTIGRSSSADWTLPDPERFISGKHAAIRFESGSYYLDDLSVNGVYVNGAPDAVGKGNAIRLADGDRLALGEYEMVVAIQQQPQDDPFAMPAQPPGEDPFAAPASDPFAAPAADAFAAPAADPFAEPAADPFAAPQQPADPFPPAPPAADPFASVDAPDPGSPPAAGDPFGLGVSGSDAGADPLAGGTGGTLDPLDLLSPTPTPTPQPAAPDPGTMPDNQSATGDYFAPPAASNEQIPENWDMTSFNMDPAPAQAPQPAAPPTPPPASTAPPSPPPQPAAAPATPAQPEWTPPQPAAPTPGAPPAGPQDLMALRALLEGAGISPSKVPPGGGQALMVIAGQIFREVVQGMMEVLVARSSLKSEFRMALTVIKPVENNPLKFSPGVDEALENLLFNEGKGYLPPVEAVREGFNDIRAHQLSMIAGMRAAFSILMRRFDPVTLSSQYDKALKRGLLGGIAGKSRYWEMYSDMYEEWTKDPDECFRNLFGNEFARAYEEQMSLMSQKAKNQGQS